MAKLLCVEDGKEFQILIASALEGHDLDFTATLDEGRKLLEKQKQVYELLLLDLSLPDGNGIKFLSEFKLTDTLNSLPVFIISADNDVLSKITAFSIGADDYICKPFHPLELRARVEAKLRQSKKIEEQKDFLNIADLNLDVSKMLVINSKDKKRIDLTPLEFKILLILCKRPETIFSRNQLIDEVWGTGVYITDRTVDAHISHLRKKLSDSKLKITTVTGEGYKAVIET